MERLRGRHSVLKDINKRLVLDTIKRKPNLSRYEIAKEVKLSPATVSTMVDLLIGENLVIETGMRDTIVGRKPQNLIYNPDSAYVIGGYVESEKLGIAKMNLDGRIIQIEEVNLTENVTSEYVLEEIVRLIQKLLNGNNQNNSHVLMIALAVPGMIDTEDGVAIFSPPFGWKDVHFKEILEERLNIPVYIDNDDRLAALGEKTFGVGKGVTNLIYVDVEGGIGSGIVLNGDIYRGTHNTAGEIGHSVVMEGGPKCNCGNYGCLEALADNHAIIRQVKERIKTGECHLLKEDEITIERIIDAAQLGDKGCKEVLESAGRHLARVIANLINAFDPNVVVLTGTVFMLGDYYFNYVKEAIMKDVFNVTVRNLRIEKSKLGAKAYMLGAGTFVLQKVLIHPLSLAK